MEPAFHLYFTFEQIPHPDSSGWGIRFISALQTPPSLLTPLPADGHFGLTLLEATDAFPVPMPFVAVTVNVYEVPLVSPLTVQASVAGNGDERVQVLASGVEVTVYCIIAAPPLPAGAVQATEACALPGVAETPVGAPGTVRGVTGTDGAEGSLVPAAFVATALNVYGCPFVRSVTVQVSVAAGDRAAASGLGSGPGVRGRGVGGDRRHSSRGAGHADRGHWGSGRGWPVRRRPLRRRPRR